MVDTLDIKTNAGVKVMQGRAFAAFDFKGKPRIEFHTENTNIKYVLYPSDHLLTSLFRVLKETGRLDELLKIEVK